MKIFGFFSMLYSLGYFTIRSMLPLLLLGIIGDHQDLAKISMLSAVFNFSYGIAQVFNGALIDKFGFRFVGITSICCFFCLFFFRANLPDLSQILIVGSLGLFSSAGSLAITFFAANCYKSSPIVLGFLRLVLIISGGLLITTCSKFNFMFNAKSIAMIFQGIFVVAGIGLILFTNKLPNIQKNKNTTLNKKPDWQFVFLALSGILSAFPYFFFNGGFINSLYTGNISHYVANIAYGFGFGNLLIILSRYVNFRAIVIALCAIQGLSLSVILNLHPMFVSSTLHSIAYFFIGVSYVCHLMPVTYITSTYHRPIFMAGLYNCSIMFLASFGLLGLCSYVIKKIVHSSIVGMIAKNPTLTAESILSAKLKIQMHYSLLFIKIILCVSCMNLLFNIFLYKKNKS